MVQNVMAGRKVESGPPVPQPLAVRALPPEQALALPLAFILLLAGMAFLPAMRSNSTLFWSVLGAATVLLAWTAFMLVSARSRGRTLVVEVVLRPQHYLQACAHLSILLYWGWYWREVYESGALLASQLLFAFALDALLAWSRRDVYTFGFGPFPIIFSTNLFLWFKPDWFYLQFLMVAVGFAAKELIRWTKDGRRTHIFNPSSFTLTVFSLGLLFTGMTDISWGQEISITQFNPPYIYLWIFAVSLPAQVLFGTASMTLSAVATTYLFTVAYFLVTGEHFWIREGGYFPEPIPIAVFLGMHLLFTDPSTSPRTELGRVIFGIAYGLSVVALFAVLESMNLPSFYDKLLPVPILNLLIQAIDRVVRSGRLKRLDPAAFGRTLKPRQRNVAYVSVWVLFFLTMQGTVGAHATLMRGDALVLQGRIDEALTRYREYVRDNPEDSDGHQSLGRGLMQAGQAEEAVASFERAVALEPDNPDAHDGLGQALMQVGRPWEAVTSLRRAVDLRPDSPTVHYNLGAALTQAGRSAEAVPLLERATELDPDNTAAYNNLGVALLRSGFPQDAVTALRRATELQPDSAEAHHNLGQALMQAGQTEDAVPSLQRAVALQSDNPTAHSDLGVALMRTGRLPEAVASLERAVELQADDANARENLAVAHDGLGVAMLQAGRTEEALTSLRRAVAVKPDLPEARYNLARALAASGQPAAAMDQLREALRLRPGWPPADSALTGLSRR